MRSGPAVSAAGTGTAPPARTLLLFIVVVLCWGTGWLPIRYQVDEAPPEVTLFWRFAAADMLLWAIVWWRGAEWRYSPSIHVHYRLLDANLVQQLQNARPGTLVVESAMQFQYLADLPFDCVQRIERCHRLLEDDRDAIAADRLHPLNG